MPEIKWFFRTNTQHNILLSLYIKVYGEAWCEYIGVVTCTSNADAMRARFYVCICMHARVLRVCVCTFISLCARAMSVDVLNATLRKWIHSLLGFLCVLSAILCFSVYFSSRSFFHCLSLSLALALAPPVVAGVVVVAVFVVVIFLYSVPFHSIPFAPIDSTII